MRHLADGTKTERNATEQLLMVEGRLELAQEVARMGYWDWDTATDTVECSDELYRIFGLTLPADGGAEYTAFQGVHPDDLSSVQEAIRIGLETHQPYEVEHRLVHPNGDERAVVARGVASYGADGKPTRVFGISYDVTEHRQAERELRARNALYRDLFEAAGDMIFLTDLDGEVRSVNRAAEEALDYPRDHLSGRNIFDALMNESDAQVARAHLDSVIAGSSESEFLAISFIAEDGTEIPGDRAPRIVRLRGACRERAQRGAAVGRRRAALVRRAYDRHRDAGDDRPRARGARGRYPSDVARALHVGLPGRRRDPDGDLRGARALHRQALPQR
jgi:PAS domain S-box-containing protein